MDLSATCPYCDSESATYTFLPGPETGTGTLVFACTHCGSHVESRVTDFEPSAFAAIHPTPGIPAQRLEVEPALDDHPAAAGAPPRSSAG